MAEFETQHDRSVDQVGNLIYTFFAGHTQATKWRHYLPRAMELAFGHPFPPKADFSGDIIYTLAGGGGRGLPPWLKFTLLSGPDGDILFAMSDARKGEESPVIYVNASRQIIDALHATFSLHGWHYDTRTKARISAFLEAKRDQHAA